MIVPRLGGWPWLFAIMKGTRNARRPLGSRHRGESGSGVEWRVPRHIEIGREIECVVALAPEPARRRVPSASAPSPRPANAPGPRADRAMPCRPESFIRAKPTTRLSGEVATHSIPWRQRPCSSDASGCRHVQNPPLAHAHVRFRPRFRSAAKARFLRGRGARIIAASVTPRQIRREAPSPSTSTVNKQLGRKIEDEDVVTQVPIKAMIATFDRPDKVPAEGEPIAPGWHLLFLHSYARPAQLGKMCGLHRRRAAGDPDAAAHVCRLDLHLRRRHPGGRQGRREIEIQRHPVAPGQHRQPDRHHPDAPHLHAARAGAHRSRQHGVPRGSEGGRQGRVPVRDAAPATGRGGAPSRPAR